MVTKRNIILFMFLLLAGMSLGQTSSWRQMGRNEGLSSLQTRQIVCLPNGRMLLVVEGMINLYDGQRFQPMELDRRLTADVHSFLNTDYFFDHQGRLWIRTLHQLTAIDVTTLRPLDVRQLLRDARIDSPLQNFFVDAHGVAWMHVGQDSLMRCDWQGEAQLVMRIGDTDTDGMQATVCDLVELQGRHYILLSSGRLVCLDSKTGRQLYTTLLGEPSQGFTLMAWSDGERLLVSITDSNQRRLARFDTRSHRLAETVYEGRVYDVCPDGKGGIWVCSQQEIVHLDHRFRTLERINDLPYSIRAMAIDHQGGLWACTTSEGLLYHSGMRPRVTMQSLPGQSSADALLARPDGSVVAGTSHGLFVQRLRHANWETMAGRDKLMVVHLETSASGGMLVSTANHGALEIDPLGHTLWNADEQWDDRLRNRVEFCTEMPDGRRLLNVRMNRLMTIDPQTKAVNLASNHQEEVVREFRRIIDALPLSDGWLMGTQNGIFFLRLHENGNCTIDKERFATLADNPWSVKCNCLFRHANGNIYVGTQNGLLCYDERGENLSVFTTREGLAHNTVLSIIDDTKGRLWIATMGGICCLSPERGDIVSFGSDDGVEDCEFVERAAVRTSDGSLLFGSRNGVYTLQPDSMQLPDLPLHPQLMSVRVGGDEQTLSDLKKITLPHDRNFVTLTLSTLNYAYAGHTRFRYQLQGIDPEPTVVTGKGDRLEIAYTALPPGHYALEVQASMQGGDWGEPLRFEIVIRPPLWRTWWACLIYMVLVLGIGFYVRRSYRERQSMHLRINELLREKELFAQSMKAKEEPEEPDEAPKKQKEFSPADRHFLEKALGCIDRNMANTEYTIDNFASDMAMERSTLYRKLQAVMGQGPLEFVRTIRLKRAAELLRTGRYSVTEVSELVGFNTPRYFTKHFREMYGVRPSEYR